MMCAGMSPRRSTGGTGSRPNPSVPAAGTPPSESRSPGALSPKDKERETRRRLGRRLKRSKSKEWRATAPVKAPRATGATRDAMKGGD
jgi:hypothetical protein